VGLDRKPPAWGLDEISTPHPPRLRGEFLLVAGISDMLDDGVRERNIERFVPERETPGVRYDVVKSRVALIYEVDIDEDDTATAAGICPVGRIAADIHKSAAPSQRLPE